MKLTDLYEVRYAGEKPSFGDVVRKYHSLENRINYREWQNPEGIGQPYSLSEPLGIQVTQYGRILALEILFHWDMPQDAAKKWVIKFLHEKNVPYTDINVAYVDKINDPTWAVIVEYDPTKFNK